MSRIAWRNRGRYTNTCRNPLWYSRAAEYLATLVKESLPLDQVRRDEAIVWNAFAAEAAHTPWIAEILIEQDEVVLNQLADTLRALGNAAPEETAAGIIAVSDGFGLTGGGAAGKRQNTNGSDCQARLDT